MAGVGGVGVGKLKQEYRMMFYSSSALKCNLNCDRIHHVPNFYLKRLHYERTAQVWVELFLHWIIKTNKKSVLYPWPLLYYCYAKYYFFVVVLKRNKNSAGLKNGFCASLISCWDTITDQSFKVYVKMLSSWRSPYKVKYINFFSGVSSCFMCEENLRACLTPWGPVALQRDLFSLCSLTENIRTARSTYGCPECRLQVSKSL